MTSHTADRPAAVPPGGRGVAKATVDEGADGQRLDNWLIRELKGVPKSAVYRILRKGEIRVNGKRAKPDQRLAAGDEVRLPPMRAEVVPVGPDGEPLVGGAGPRKAPKGLTDAIESAIIFEDDRFLVIDKPSGLAVHGGSGLSFGVIEALRASRPTEELELVHRLDRDTSGLLLVARDRGSLRIAHALIRDGQMEKQYLTLVLGNWPHGTKLIDAPLATQNRSGGERVVKVDARGKESRSTFIPVDFFGNMATLMQVQLDTGRTHQIRVHAAYAGHPVAGDDKYATREDNALVLEAGLTRMFLHAQSLSFEWPGGKQYAFSAPLPPDLAEFIDSLGNLKRKRKKAADAATARRVGQARRAAGPRKAR